MTGEIIYNVPIFPLNTVLFPSMPLPLQIFEQRYLTMLNDLRRGDGRFCVALIKEGREVGGPAEPYEVACLAELVHVQPLHDSRYLIVAVGVERVKIVHTDRAARPYLTGALEVWSDETDGADPALMERASHLFLRYVRLAHKLSAQEEGQNMPVPTEPDLLSYVIATELRVDTAIHQRLLEVPRAGERIQDEIEILENELPILQAFASTPWPPSVGFGQFSAN